MGITCRAAQSDLFPKTDCIRTNALPRPLALGAAFGHQIPMTNFRTQAKAAEAAMRDVFPPTPLQRNELLSQRFGADIYLKREDLSPVRSYKIRGALNAMRKQGARICLFVPLRAIMRRAWPICAARWARRA